MSFRRLTDTLRADRRFLDGVLWLGLVWLICAPWLIASAGLYQKVFLVLFLLPALVVFITGLERATGPWDLLFLWSFLFFAAWLALRMGVAGEWKYAKRMFYIFLFLVGMKYLARVDQGAMARSLLGCLVFSGFMAWFSVIDFYFLKGNSWGQRVVPVGQFKVIIYSAQMVGALFIASVALFSNLRLGLIWRGLVVISMLGFLAFLLLNQTRWVWISVGCALLALFFMRPSKKAFGVFFAFFLVLVLGYFYYPDAYLSRGLSYRDALWVAGIELGIDNWLVGVGSENYSLLANGVGFNHPHNVYLEIAVRLGLVAFGLWLLLWLRAGWLVFEARMSCLGHCALTLWIYCTLVVMTDGQIPWSKPSEIWFVTWLPLGLVLLVSSARSRPDAPGSRL